MGGSNDLSLKVILSAQDQASGNLKGFGSTLQNLAGDAGPLLGGMLSISAAAIGIGIASAKMAADYQQNMNMVQALTGASNDQMSQYDAGVKALAVDAGVAPTALAKGLYNVLSASYSGADAMKILTLATQDSKIGMTDAATTSNALTNVLRTFGTATSQATRVNGEMLETVTLGKSTFAQYASSITKAASTSKQFGQNMETMNAAWSTLTSTGISAGQATTDYDQLLGVMYSSIGTVTASLHKNGIAFNETKFNAMSFGDKVTYLNQALTVANDKHVKITGATKQASQALQALAGHTDMYNSNLKALSDSQAMNQKTSQAWAITQGGFNQTMSRLGATVQVLMIDLGQQLLPVLTSMAQAVLPIVSGIATWITQSGIVTTGLNLLGGVIKGVVGFVGSLVTGIGNLVGFFKQNSVAAAALLIPLGILGTIMANMAVGALVDFLATIPELVAGFGVWAAGAWTAAAGTIAATWPLLALGAAIGAVIAIILLLITHWKQVSQIAEQVWGHIVAFFQDDVVKPMVSLFNHLGTGFHDDVVVPIQNLLTSLSTTFQNVTSSIASFFTNLWNSILSGINNVIKWFQNLPGAASKEIQSLISQGEKMFMDFWNNVVKDAKSIFANLGNDIGNAFKSAVDFLLINPVNGIIDGINRVTGIIHIPAIPHIPKLALGGDVISAGSVLVGENGPEVLNVPSGASVVPLSGSSASRSNGGNVFNVVVYAGNANAQQTADLVIDKLDRLYRRSGVMGNPAAGARSS